MYSQLAQLAILKFNDTSEPSERKMKSTNRQVHLKLDNQSKSYVKMCLLNWILISIVTLTQSLYVPEKSQMTLSSAIQQHPKFHATLLNTTVVPFVDHCEAIRYGRDKMLCAAYFEMVKKLDDSNVDRLSTVDDFEKAMSLYDQTKVDDFCSKFPGKFAQYTESLRLSNYVNKSCKALCSDDTLDIDNPVVTEICRVFAIGFDLSNKTLPVQQSVIRANNGTGNQEPVEANQNSEMSQQVKFEGSVETTSDNTKQKQNTTLPVVRGNGVKNEEILPKQIPNPKPVPRNENNLNAKSESEVIPIVPTNLVNDSQTASVKSEVKLVNTLDPSATDIKGVPTIQKTAKNEQTNVQQNIKAQPAPQSVNEEQNINEEQNVNEELKEEEDKLIFKASVTGDNFDESDINDKDKLVNVPDDSTEDANDNTDDEEMDTNDQQIKAFADKTPPKEQMQNEDPFTDDTDSNFFTYFMFLLLVCVIAYVVYHNKSKMLALVLEGRRSSTNGRTGLSRRKHTAAYRKLDSNLEEAITSSANGRSTQVIY